MRPATARLRVERCPHNTEKHVADGNFSAGVAVGSAAHEAGRTARPKGETEITVDIADAFVSFFTPYLKAS